MKTEQKIHMIRTTNLRFVDGKFLADMDIKGTKVFSECGRKDYFDKQNVRGSGQVFTPNDFNERAQLFPTIVCSNCWNAYLNLQQEKKKLTI
jgi:hypothetical protein